MNIQELFGLEKIAHARITRFHAGVALFCKDAGLTDEDTSTMHRLVQRLITGTSTTESSYGFGKQADAAIFSGAHFGQSAFTKKPSVLPAAKPLAAYSSPVNTNNSQGSVWADHIPSQEENAQKNYNAVMSKVPDWMNPTQRPITNPGQEMDDLFKNKHDVWKQRIDQVKGDRLDSLRASYENDTGGGTFGPQEARARAMAQFGPQAGKDLEKLYPESRWPSSNNTPDMVNTPPSAPPSAPNSVASSTPTATAPAVPPASGKRDDWKDGPNEG